MQPGNPNASLPWSRLRVAGLLAFDLPLILVFGPFKAMDLLLPSLATEPQGAHFVISVWVALGLLVFRVAFESVALPGFRVWLKKWGDGLDKVADKAFDDVWIGVFSGALEAFAWWTVFTNNGGCTPWATSTCLLGWPDHPVSVPQKLYFQLMFGYYLYEMLGTFTGKGTILRFDMVVHHALTMALMVAAYYTNLMRMGLMNMALLDLSNPFLHLAKTLNTLKVEPWNWVVFATFALTFFIARVVLMPFCVLWPAWTDGFNTGLPYTWAFVCDGIMNSLYVMQLFWFYKIVQLARSGGKQHAA